MHERLDDVGRVCEAVVRIDGPSAAGLLAGEAGIHAFELEKEAGQSGRGKTFVGNVLGITQ